jgi:hypothetical protein
MSVAGDFPATSTVATISSTDGLITMTAFVEMGFTVPIFTFRTLLAVISTVEVTTFCTLDDMVRTVRPITAGTGNYIVCAEDVSAVSTGFNMIFAC